MSVSFGKYYILEFNVFCTMPTKYKLNWILLVLSGSVGSSICLPWYISHNVIPEEERIRTGVTNDLVRISVGIEDVSDLITDLDKALSSGSL